MGLLINSFPVSFNNFHAMSLWFRPNEIKCSKVIVINLISRPKKFLISVLMNHKRAYVKISVSSFGNAQSFVFYLNFIRIPGLFLSRTRNTSNSFHRNFFTNQIVLTKKTPNNKKNVLDDKNREDFGNHFLLIWNNRIISYL